MFPSELASWKSHICWCKPQAKGVGMGDKTQEALLQQSLWLDMGPYDEAFHSLLDLHSHLGVCLSNPTEAQEVRECSPSSRAWAGRVWHSSFQTVEQLLPKQKQPAQM